jgi:hypothetical protein
MITQYPNKYNQFRQKQKIKINNCLYNYLLGVLLNCRLEKLAVLKINCIDLYSLPIRTAE